MDRKKLSIIALSCMCLLAGALASTTKNFSNFLSVKIIAGSENSDRVIKFDGNTLHSNVGTKRYISSGTTKLSNQYFLVCDNCASEPTTGYVGVAPASSGTPMILYISTKSDGSDFAEFQKAKTLSLTVSKDTNYNFYSSNDGNSFIMKASGQFKGDEVSNLSLSNAKYFKLECKGNAFVKSNFSNVSIIYDCDPNYIEEEKTISGVYSCFVSGLVSSYNCSIDFDNCIYRASKVNGDTYTYYFYIDSIIGDIIFVKQDSTKTNSPFIGSYVNLWTSDTNLSNQLILNGDTITTNLFISSNDVVGKEAIFTQQ